MATTETGTRHRAAERVGRQIDVPVISVSEDMSVVTIHQRGQKHTLEPIPQVLARADQALQILGRYKTRLGAVSGSLSALEVEDLVTVRDVATVLQRGDGAARLGGDRGLRGRARCRRPPRDAAARGGWSAASRRTAAWSPRTTSARRSTSRRCST